MKSLFTISLILLAYQMSFCQTDARATIKTTGVTAEAWIRAETAVTFPLANNVVAINLAFSLPANGETNPSNAPDFISATSPLSGVTVNTTIPVEINFDRFIYTILVSGNVPAMPQWDPNTEHKVLNLTFGAEVTGDYPRLDNWLNSGGGQGQGYFYFTVGPEQRSDTEGDPFYSGVEGSYPNTDFYVESSSPLPITLVSFDAKKSGDRNSHLSWSTSSEINSSHFVIQRSYDKKVWSKIGRVNATGNSQFIENYEFIDQNVYNGADNNLSVYYRLQMADLDGYVKNSPIENVVFGNDAKISKGLAISVYPNPATDGVQVEWDANNSDQPTLLEIYDITGKLVLQQKVSENANQEYIDFGPAKITSGLYLLRILNGTEPIDHKQIVVGQSR